MITVAYKRRFYYTSSIVALVAGALCLWYALWVYAHHHGSDATTLWYRLGWFVAYVSGGACWAVPLLCISALPFIHDRRYLLGGLSFCILSYQIIARMLMFDPLSPTIAGGVMGQLGVHALTRILPESAVLLLACAGLVFGVYLMIGHAWIRHLVSWYKPDNSPDKSNVQMQPAQETDPINDMVYRARPDTSESETSSEEQVVNEYPFPHLAVSEQRASEFEGQQREANEKARVLEEKLLRFGIKGQVVSITVGPVVTLFEYQPHIDTRISKILAREDDLALALQALSLRIIAPMPGKSVVGFEVAQEQRAVVLFNQLYHHVKHSQARLPLVLGQNTIGAAVVVDLASMPHVLVAGSTGSGKSVALNTMLVSLLCARKPEDLRLIIIDPKKLDFAHYDAIPHLLFPIVTHADMASAVLRWAVKTMNERYERMAKVGVRNAYEYHAVYGDMASIVIAIDEFADLMMTSGKDIEDLIVRLAQMARAAGIHIILATQRPSVDVITGLIKANFPSRIAFKVTSRIDSRTILDVAGADKLLGRGDMLYLDGQGSITRIHGAYITDAELIQVIEQVKAYGPPVYEELTSLEAQSTDVLDQQDQKLFDDIVQFVQQHDEISISLLQRVFRIGYNRSARMMDVLESRGVILPADGGKMRKVLRMQRDAFS